MGIIMQRCHCSSRSKPSIDALKLAFTQAGVIWEADIASESWDLIE